MTLGVGRADHNILDFIKEYLQSRGLLKKDFLSVQGRKRVEYWSEDHFWQDVLQTGQVYDTCQVLLKDFQLIHWIPRAPGQYYTRDACHSREAAQRFVVARERNHVVFDPQGKSEMVIGGVGCLRLSEKQIGGERLYFLCATSSGIAHKGLLIGLPRNLYEKVIEDIERRGAVICSISGQIRYWAGEETLPTYAPRNIPRMYLYANKIDISWIKPDAIDVTAAVLFRGTVGGEEGTFFVYSHFNPCERHSIDNTIDQCINWMERTYVRGLYNGQILTDFDEVTPRFEDVTFPVRALMNPRTDRRAMIKMCSELYLHRSSHDREAVETLVEHIISERTMTMNITITGDGNVVGNNNKVVTKINEGLSGQDVRQLGEAFALFRAEVLQIDAPEKVRNRAVRAIEDAEEEAADKSPDPKTIEDGLKRAKDILESADQVYDKSVNWGKRLSTLAQVLMKTIPAGWTWLSSVL
jgi:hypothetical protein